MSDYLAQMHEEYPRIEYILQYYAAIRRPSGKSWPGLWTVHIWSVDDHGSVVAYGSSHYGSKVSAEDALRQALDWWIEKHGDD